MSENLKTNIENKRMKNIRNLSFIIAGIVLLSACGNTIKKDVDAVIKGMNLPEIKAMKSELTQQVSQLNVKIERLDAAIQKLDTTHATIRAAYVEIDTIDPQAFKHYIEVQGYINSEENILVSPEMAGVITQVYVDEGDYVRKGQVLARMDASALKSQLQQVETSYHFAKTTYDKRKNLWEQNIGSEIQLLQAQTQMEGLKSQINAIEAQIKKFNIVSPINGIVDDVKVKIGEMANPGFSGIRVVNMTKLNARASIPGQYAGRVERGDSVDIYLPSLNETIREKISFVSQAIDPDTRSIMVQVNLGNQYDHLKPNMIAKMEINDYSRDSAIIVSSNVLLRNPDNLEEYYVMGVDEVDGHYVARTYNVTIGKQYSGKTEILKGLPENPVIISFGFESVADGQPIKFNKK